MSKPLSPEFQEQRKYYILQLTEKPYRDLIVLQIAITPVAMWVACLSFSCNSMEYDHSYTVHQMFIYT